MEINVTQIIVIIVIAGLAYWANDQLNKVPFLVNLIRVLIVGVAILMLLQSCGIMGSGTHIRIG